MIAGNFDEALNYFKRDLEISIAYLGEQHDSTINIITTFMS